MTPTELPKRVRDQIDRLDAALPAIDALLLRLGVQGLQRASRSTADELLALKQTAHNAGLITVERQLDALATYVGRYLARDPLFALDDYRGALNRAWLLTRAATRLRGEGRLPADLLDVIGEARRSYEPVEGPLDVQALGAHGWVSDTGFVGVTVHVHAPGHGVLELSTARPTMHFGDDPARLYHFEAAGDSGLTLRDLAHGAWRLDGARLSRDGRLGLHAGLSIRPTAWLGARAYADLHAADWSTLLERLRAAAAHPVGARDAVLACVEPAALHPLLTDPKRARVRTELPDRRGARLVVQVPLRRENNLLVDNLERIFGSAEGRVRTAPPPQGLFGRVSVAGDEMLFLPLTAIFDAGLRLGGRGGAGRVNEVHLSLESLQGARSG